MDKKEMMPFLMALRYSEPIFEVMRFDELKFKGYPQDPQLDFLSIEIGICGQKSAARSRDPPMNRSPISEKCLHYSLWGYD